jgi:cytochrome c biogenesis protein CcmG, thiol:disulfide interchange protein DsbE
MADRRPVAPFLALAVVVVLGALIWVLAGAEPGQSTTANSHLLGRPAPEVVSTSLDGERFELARRKGSWVVLNFFNSTCVPCVREHPELVAFSERQEQLGTEGAELYTVINDDRDEVVRAWFDANGGDWPKLRDPDGSIAVAFGVSMVPETWIIDPNGFVRLRVLGEVTPGFLDEQLEMMNGTPS